MQLLLTFAGSVHLPYLDIPPLLYQRILGHPNIALSQNHTGITGRLRKFSQHLGIKATIGGKCDRLGLNRRVNIDLEEILLSDQLVRPV